MIGHMARGRVDPQRSVGHESWWSPPPPLGSPTPHPRIRRIDVVRSNHTHAAGRHSGERTPNTPGKITKNTTFRAGPRPRRGPALAEGGPPPHNRLPRGGGWVGRGVHSPRSTFGTGGGASSGGMGGGASRGGACTPPGARSCGRRGVQRWNGGGAARRGACTLLGARFCGGRGRSAVD